MTFSYEQGHSPIGPFEPGVIRHFYTPGGELRQVKSLEDGLVVLDGRGNKLSTHRAGTDPFKIDERTIYPLMKGEPAPRPFYLPPLD